MAVTELALLRLLPGTTPTSPSLLANLAKAKLVMEKASGFEFRYYHCTEEPSSIYIFGAWPSVEFHMAEFIPGSANQDMLELLKNQVRVEWMFHLDIDPTRTNLPWTRSCVAIARHFIKDGARHAFMETYEQNKHELEGVVGRGQVVGGWRLDEGYESKTEKQGQRNRREELVLFAGRDDVEQDWSFTETDRFGRYSQIRQHVDGAETKHAVKLQVNA